MRHWPPFCIWYSDLLRIAFSWKLSRQEVESVPKDWYPVSSEYGQLQNDDSYFSLYLPESPGEKWSAIGNGSGLCFGDTAEAALAAAEEAAQ